MSKVHTPLVVTLASALAVLSCSGSPAAREQTTSRTTLSQRVPPNTPAAVAGAPDRPTPAGSADADASGVPSVQLVEHGPQGRENMRFDRLDEMVATSVAVVEGRITSVEPGRRSAHGTDGGIPYTLATLEVQEVLAGELPTEDVVFEDGDIFYSRNEEGDAGIYFIHRMGAGGPGAGYYRLMTSQGRYRIVGDEALQASNPDDPLAQELEQLSLTELKARIADAVKAINRGEVDALPIPGPAQPTR